MLKIRVLTASAFLAVFLPALFFLPRTAWLAFCAAGLGVAAWEWASLAALSAAGRASYAVSLIALFVAPAILAVPWANGWHVPSWAYAGGALFWIVLAPLWIWRRWRIGGRAALLGVGAVTLLPAFAAAVDLRDIHPGLLLALLVTVWISDTAAYFSGRRFGRHKLAPLISPGKTWEGVAGGAVAVAVYYVALSRGFPGWDWWSTGRGVSLFAGVALMSVVGDLFESWMKRQAGAKDSGALLPGHGGILDRVDSMTSSMPFAAALLLYLK